MPFARSWSGSLWIFAASFVLRTMAAGTTSSDLLDRLPLRFEENRGQGARWATFVTRGAGYRVEFFAGTQAVKTRVTAILKIPAAQRAWWHDIIFDCRLYPGAIYQSGAMTVAPDHRRAVLEILRNRFPDLVLLDINEFLQRFRQLGASVLVMVKIIGWLTVSTAACALFAFLRSQHLLREGEIAILRALGARQSAIIGGLVAEHLVLGGLGGLFGALLGSAITGLLLRSIAALSDWSFVPLVIPGAIVFGAAFATLVGMWVTRPLLRRKPMEILVVR